MNEIYSPSGQVVGISPGNVKIYVSDNRLIYKIYPFDIICQRKTERCTDRKEQEEYQKRENAIAKRIKLLGYGLCNNWQYFFTGTIDPERFQANDYDTVSKLISYEFKKIKQRCKEFEYCFILEPHKNGNYHAHGFVNIPNEFINPFPYYQRPNSSYKIYPSKSKFVQFGIKQELYDLGLNVISPCIDINNIADYCGKYILKDIATGEKNSRSIFKSHGLKNFTIEYGNYIGDNFNCLQDIAADQYSLKNVIYHERIYQGNIMQLEVRLKWKVSY